MLILRYARLQLNSDPMTKYMWSRGNRCPNTMKCPPERVLFFIATGNVALIELHFNVCERVLQCAMNISIASCLERFVLCSKPPLHHYFQIPVLLDEIER
jgi:hypothetical protein